MRILKAVSHKRMAMTVVAASFTLLAGACAADSSGSDSGGVKFMTVTAIGSPLTNYPDVEASAKAAVDAINKEGGVNGKKIEYEFCNTQGNANQAMACARKAHTDSVDAVVGQVDIFSTQSMPILEKEGIPAIGNLPAGGAIDYESSASYPLHEGNYGAFTGGPLACRAAGKNNVAIVATDFAATAAQVDIVSKAIDAAGIQNAGEVKIPAEGVTDFAPYAQKLKDTRADCAEVLLGPADLQSMYKAVQSIGLKTQLAGTVFSFGDAEATAVGSASNGIWALSPFPSVHDMTVPAIKQWNADLSASGVDANDPARRRAAGFNTWLAFHAAVEVAKKIQGPVTAQSLTSALKNARGVNVSGISDWSPADLGTGSLGTFKRLPGGSFNVLTFQGGRMTGTDQPLVTDPLQGIR